MKIYTPILITAGFFISSFAMAAPPADDLLAGPTIVVEEVTSQDMTNRVLKEQGKSNKVSSRKQSRMWMTALEVIDLTKDQEIEIDKIMAEYQKMNQIFQATHGKEIRSIRKAHDKDKNGKRDLVTTILIGAPKDQAAVPEATKKRLIELMGNAPDVTTYQEKAWVLLSAEQQALFQTKYQALIEEHKNDRKPKDEMQDRGLSPRDSRFRDRDARPEDDAIQRHSDAVDDTSLRRIKFLRQLQQLEKD